MEQFTIGVDSAAGGGVLRLQWDTTCFLLPWSVVSRPLEGEAPTIEVAVGYSKSNTSPILKLFLSRLDELVAPNQKR